MNDILSETRNIDAVREDEIDRLRARVAELEQAVRYIFKETQNTGYGNPIVMERMIDRIEECAINAIDAARGDV